MTTTTSTGIASGIGRFMDSIRAWRERLQMQRDLARIPGYEIRRMCRDLGLLHGDIDRLVAGADGPRRLLPLMLRRHGLSPAAIAVAHGAVMRDLQRVCSDCPHKRACRRALATGASAAECSRFCPNRDTLDALAREPALCATEAASRRPRVIPGAAIAHSTFHPQREGGSRRTVEPLRTTSARG